MAVREKNVACTPPGVKPYATGCGGILTATTMRTSMLRCEVCGSPAPNDLSSIRLGERPAPLPAKIAVVSARVRGPEMKCQTWRPTLRIRVGHLLIWWGVRKVQLRALRLRAFRAARRILQCSD